MKKSITIIISILLIASIQAQQDGLPVRVSKIKKITWHPYEGPHYNKPKNPKKKYDRNF